MQDLIDIIKTIKKIEGLKASDDMVLDCSTRIFISQNISRDRHPEKQQEQTQQGELATSKQIGLLRRLKYDLDYNNLTKAEAFQLIKAHKAKEEAY